MVSGFLLCRMIATICSRKIWPMPMGIHASPATDLAYPINHEALCSSEAVQIIFFFPIICFGMFVSTARVDVFTFSTLMFPKPSRSHIPKRPGGRSIPFRPTVLLAPPHRVSRGSSPRQWPIRTALRVSIPPSTDHPKGSRLWGPDRGRRWLRLP